MSPEQLRVARRFLKPGGRVIVLQPNIRHVGGAHRDYIDRRVALTERSLEEAANWQAFDREAHLAVLAVHRKAPAPDSRVAGSRLYLAFPPARQVMGQQTLRVGESAS